MSVILFLSIAAIVVAMIAFAEWHKTGAWSVTLTLGALAGFLFIYGAINVAGVLDEDVNPTDRNMMIAGAILALIAYTAHCLEQRMERGRRRRVRNLHATNS